MKHFKWNKSGRTFKTDKPNQFVYQSNINEQQTWDGLKWLPYLWKPPDNELRYGHADNGIEFASDKQILKKMGRVLVSSSKFFVQKETSPGVWENQPHGFPTKNIQQDYPTEGRCTSYLNFPDAKYDLKVGLEVGRSAQAVFGFRFRAPISGRVRFVWVNDGIEKLPADWEWIWAKFAPEKEKEDRKIGIRFKNIEWRWGYDEAPFRSIQVETNPDDSKKLNIIFGPYDYTANEWLTVYPDTFGAAQIAADTDDGQEDNDTTWLVNGEDADGIGISPWGDDGGFRWDNVTVPGDATIDTGTKITYYIEYSDGTLTGNIYGIEEADPLTWAADNRPSQRNKTTANVAVSDSTASDNWSDSPELQSVVQEILDDAAFASGNAMAFAFIGGGAGDWVQVQDYGNDNTLAAKLTIVYTVNMQINIGDVWKDADSLQINIGDVWKDVAEIYINIGDVWKRIL